MQTPSGPDPLMQREPGLQSPSSPQVLPVARFGGALPSSISEDRPWVQTPSKHMVPDAQSESSTQAKAGSEVRQRIVTAIRLRTVLPLLEPSKNHNTECPNLDRPRLAEQALGTGTTRWESRAEADARSCCGQSDGRLTSCSWRKFWSYHPTCRPPSCNRTRSLRPSHLPRRLSP
jgi:hypothetical protein